ncbi:predicted protein [Naegleria gruberi]|uniref:Predicted protein n=1 Tax=Naegleria gruberi TaxID=5762 RepID=D2VPF1_NAEGR|nr:uncharacterized protein NAEGRDRAFT_51215 [Naegleria gruberi]EFC41349.1 predicted protein [Naegleria gruberi]|eukprot:XP_002674093.1 predicted protein [Naegleria gruberi strain NEG-M]
MGSSTSITHTNPSLMVVRKHKRHSAHHYEKHSQQQEHYSGNVTQSLNLSNPSTSCSSPQHSKYVHNSVDELVFSTNKPPLQLNNTQQLNTHRLQHEDDNYHSSPNYNLQHINHSQQSQIASPTSSRVMLNSPPTPTTNKKTLLTTSIDDCLPDADLTRRGHVVLPQIQATATSPQPPLKIQRENSIPTNSKDSNSPKLTTSLSNETFYSENHSEISPPDPFQSSQKGAPSKLSSTNSNQQEKDSSPPSKETFTPVVAFSPTVTDIEDDSKAIYMHPYHGSLPPRSPSNSTCSSKTSSSNCSAFSSPKEKITSPSHSSSYNTTSATYSSSPSPSSTTSGVATSSSPTTLIQPSSTTSVNASNTTPETITSTPIISKETPKPTIEISKISNAAPTTSSPISKDKLKRARPLSATKNPLVQSLTLEKFKDDLAIGRKSKSNIISDNSVKVAYSSSLTRSVEEPFKFTNPIKTKNRSTSVNSRSVALSPKKSSKLYDEDDMVMMDTPPAMFNRFELQKQLMNTDQKSKEMKIDLRSSVTLDNHRDVLSMFSHKHQQKDKGGVSSPITSPTRHHSPLNSSNDDFENIGNEEIRIFVTPPTFLPDLSHLNLTHLQLRMLSNERSQKRKMARSNKRESTFSLNGIKFD